MHDFSNNTSQRRTRTAASPVNRRRLILAATLAVASAIVINALAPSRAQAAALDQFKQFVASTQTAKGDFTQRQVRTENGVAKVVNTSSGSFVFSRPGKFIWTYQKPY